jgi:two-component sensor histidine kinase
MALALSMALHELATNAAKHGALSVSSGWVAITWSMTPNDPVLLTSLWQEQDRPLFHHLPD